MKGIKVSQNNFKTCALLLMIILGGCNSNSLSPSGYIMYMKEAKNGLTQEKEIGDMVFEVHYLTSEMMALNELRGKRVTPEKFNELKGEYEGLDYFLFEIKSKDGEFIHNLFKRKGIDPQEVESVFNYDAQNLFRTVVGSDTNACVLYNFSKTYGLSKVMQLSLAFDTKSEKHVEDHLLEFDSDIMGKGLVKFDFKASDINHIPLLTY